MKTITAIIRTTCLKSILKAFEEMKITGITISETHGIGEHIEIFGKQATNTKIEIIMPDEKVDEVINAILKYAHTGLEGDGIISVSPVDRLIKIRTKEILE